MRSFVLKSLPLIALLVSPAGQAMEPLKEKLEALKAKHQSRDVQAKLEEIESLEDRRRQSVEEDLRAEIKKAGSPVFQIILPSVHGLLAERQDREGRLKTNTEVLHRQDTILAFYESLQSTLKQSGAAIIAVRHSLEEKKFQLDIPEDFPNPPATEVEIEGKTVFLVATDPQAEMRLLDRTLVAKNKLTAIRLIMDLSRRALDAKQEKIREQVETSPLNDPAETEALIESYLKDLEQDIGLGLALIPADPIHTKKLLEETSVEQLAQKVTQLFVEFSNKEKEK